MQTILRPITSGCDHSTPRGLFARCQHLLVFGGGSKECGVLATVRCYRHRDLCHEHFMQTCSVGEAEAFNG